MKPRISKLTSVCYYHLRRIRQLRHHVDQPVLMQLASALVLSRLDYCNVVQSVLPASTIAPLRRVQNAAARPVFGLRPRDHVASALVQLHWLPLAFRIRFKTAVFMYVIHTNHSPAYISQALSTAVSNPLSQSLCSANSTDYLIPRTRTKFGERAFCFRTCDMEQSTLPSHCGFHPASTFSNLVKVLTLILFYRSV
jgi:hypothetical protein